MVVMTFVVVMMRGPWPRGSSYQNSVLVSRHRVYHVGWHEQKATDRICLQMGGIGSESYFQGTLDHGDPGI